MRRGTPPITLAMLALSALAAAGCARSNSNQSAAYRAPAPHPAPLQTLSAADSAAELAFQQRPNTTARTTFATVPTDR